MKGMANWNAWAIDQMPRQIESQSGNDHASAASKRPDAESRRAASELLGDSRNQTGQLRRQHPFQACHRAPQPLRDLPPAGTARRGQQSRRRRTRPAHFTTAKPVGFTPARSLPENENNEASRTSTVIVSSSRSGMIVARRRSRSFDLQVARRLPSQEVRADDLPALAGNTALAANPTAVARNEFANVVAPSGSSRNFQRSAESRGSESSSRATARAIPAVLD